MTPETSVNAGVKYPFLKGMGSNTQGVMNWRIGQGGDWTDAISNYNSNPKIPYLEQVQKLHETIGPASRFLSEKNKSLPAF